MLKYCRDTVVGLIQTSLPDDVPGTEIPQYPDSGIPQHHLLPGDDDRYHWQRDDVPRYRPQQLHAHGYQLLPLLTGHI